MPPVNRTPPTVAIVMATYNRSNVLRHAIASVRQQSIADWELIVVGDECTDDSEAVVAGFADERIRFVNRSRNAGEQSAPNNDGVALASAPFLAFLNHDDIWLPHHLERQLATLRGNQADLAIALGLVIRPPASPAMCGVSARDGVYLPTMNAPASLWVMKRDLAERVGPWRSAFALRQAPSQDWLQRAHRGSAKIVGSGSVSVLLPQSGAQPGCYRDRREDVHATLLADLDRPGYIADCVAQALMVWHECREQGHGRRLALEACYSSLRWLLYRMGVRPPTPQHWLRFARRGALIRRLRRLRGLPADPAPHSEVKHHHHDRP